MNELRSTLPAVARGFWMDLRSKRDILPMHLGAATCAGYNYYDPLLTPKIGITSVAPGFDWLASVNTRSWQLNVHSFRFADFWILAYQQDGDASILGRLEDVVLDYLGSPWKQRDTSNFEFIFSDVSVASRAAVIAYLLGRITAGGHRSGHVAVLEEGLREHVEWASSDANYNSNNHGLFNDMHLLLGLVNAPQMRCLSDVGERITGRLVSTFLDLQVNEEGVHLEHTPSYALLWVLLGRKIQVLIKKLAETSFDYGVHASERLQLKLDKVTTTLWWFTKPSGELINVGDQGRTDAPRWVREQTGTFGWRLFPKGGYAFYKDADSYLAFVGAYHATKKGRSGYRSASHKQRDELHLIWSESGRDILIDTGLRAYDFGMERRYTYSKQAHNTLSLADGDYMTAGILEYMDATAPYGSAIRQACRLDAEGNWYAFRGEDPLLAREGVRHERLLLLEPGRWLLVCDTVRMPKGHKAEWNFHLSEAWRCTSHGAGSAIFRADETTLAVSRFADTPVNSEATFLHRGDFLPMRGWRFAGDPFAVPNLRFVEWLGAGGEHLRITAFCLGEQEAKVLSAEMRREEAELSLEVVLFDGKRERPLVFRVPETGRPTQSINQSNPEDFGVLTSSVIGVVDGASCFGKCGF